MSTIEKAVEKLLERRGPSEASTDAETVATEHQADSGNAHEVQTGAPPDDAPHPVPRDADTAGDDSGLFADLDFDRLAAAGMLTPDAPDSRVAEEFRRIKRPLLMNAFGAPAKALDNANLIMVTSAMAGEGKTFCSISLAVSIAMERDKTVLLVDADITKATATRLLAGKADKGLIDAVAHDGLSVGDVMMATSVPKLRFVPAGPRRSDVTELLASEKMTRVVQELATRYADRIVIFDTPPLLTTSEARVLAGLMGQIVMIVAAEQTTQSVVKEASKEALGLIGKRQTVGLVLNKIRPRTRGSYYYKYYKYGT